MLRSKRYLGVLESYYALHINEFDTAKVEVLVGAFMVLKRALCITSLAGFDEDYFMYGEDMSISPLNPLKEGYDNYYFGGSTAVIHYKGESTRAGCSLS